MSNENKQTPDRGLFGNRFDQAGVQKAKQIFAAATSQMSFKPKRQKAHRRCRRWRSWVAMSLLAKAFEKDLNSDGNGNNNLPALQDQDGLRECRVRKPVEAGI